jgi:hypothetical protein
VRRLRDLEKENARLKLIVADQALDLAMAKDVIEGKAWRPPANAWRSQSWLRATQAPRNDADAALWASRALAPAIGPARRPRTRLWRQTSTTSPESIRAMATAVRRYCCAVAAGRSPTSA